MKNVTQRLVASSPEALHTVRYIAEMGARMYNKNTVLGRCVNRRKETVINDELLCQLIQAKLEESFRTEEMTITPKIVQHER
jgi:hypothetical protein